MKKYKVWLMRLIPVAFMLVYTIGLSEILYQSLIRTTTDNCREELSIAHGVVTGEISNRFTSNITMLDLASDAIMMNADMEDEATILAYLADVRQKTMFDRIDVVFPNGTILVQSTGERVADDGEKTFDELIAERTHLSPRVSDFLTGQEVIHVFSPITDHRGQPIAILCGTIYCANLSDLFTSSHYGEDAQIFLVDMRDGNIVLDKRKAPLGNIHDMNAYNSPDEHDGKDYIADILAGNIGTIEYTSPTYGKTYTAYAPVAKTDYSLTMVLQEDTVFAAVNDLKHLLMWVGVVEVTLLILLAIWIYFIMRRSMQTEGRAQSAELELLQKKELDLEKQYAITTERQQFLETLALNLPGGYHRCTTDHRFRVSFMSNSFTQVTGYTMEQMEDELDGSYIGVVAPEDLDYFMSLAPQLERDGFIHCAYRIRRRDGSIRWVQDTTQYVQRENEQYYQCALMDITEQIEEIEHSRQAAEASSLAKSTFLFNISHDVRTTMNAIQGFSRMIEDHVDDPVLVKETIAKINQASHSLMMLMNDVLDISRIERGKEEINLQPVQLREQTQNLYEMFAADMAAAGIQFVMEGGEIDDLIMCDHLKMTRILMNMLSNAKKFTPAGGTVTFGVSRINKNDESVTYRFYVRDTGIGMSPDFKRRAFEQFERERTSTESGIIGSGLGLAIIKMLVELMDGTLELESELGKGTEISAILTFPMADQAPYRQRTADDTSMQSLSGKRVLLVEDNDFNREIARYILEGIGLVVEEAVNGEVCIEKLWATSPDAYDLILMDIQMPVMDGYTATETIRRLPEQWLTRIPIVAMTANAFEEDKQKCLDIGMNGHIGKPIDVSELIHVLSEVLR